MELLLEDEIKLIYKICSIPLRCKGEIYADSATGRKIVESAAAEGKVCYVPGGKQYVNRKLERPLYVDFAWYQQSTLHYRCMIAESINKHGLEWKLVLSLDFRAGSSVPTGCNNKKDIEYWLDPKKDVLFKQMDLDKAICAACDSTSLGYDFRKFITKNNIIVCKDIQLLHWTGNSQKYIITKNRRAGIRKWLHYTEKKHISVIELQNRKFGFELEFTGISRDTAANTVAKVLNTTKTYIGGTYNTHIINDCYGRTWKILRDASIYPTVTANRTNPNLEHYKCELVSPILRYNDFPTITAIVKALKAKGAKINNTCGLHVHVNVDDYNAVRLRNLVNMISEKEDLMIKSLNVSSVRISRWCKKLDYDFVNDINSFGENITMSEIKKSWYNKSDSIFSHHYDNTRYQLLNLHSYFEKKGVEFRLFNATLDATKLTSNIILSLAICCSAARYNGWNVTISNVHSEKAIMHYWLTCQLGLEAVKYRFLCEYMENCLESRTIHSA